MLGAHAAGYGFRIDGYWLMTNHVHGDRFLSKVERLLGRRVRPLPVGRQRGWGKKKAKKDK